MNDIITLSGVSKLYRTKGGTVTALDHIDLHIASGRRVEVKRRKENKVDEKGS